MSPELHAQRGRCGTGKKYSTALCVSDTLRDLPDGDRCPIADLVEKKLLVERIFAEYQTVKRLGFREDTSIHPAYLTALDVELQQIERKDYEHKQRQQKARDMRARRR